MRSLVDLPWWGFFPVAGRDLRNTGKYCGSGGILRRRLVKWREMGKGEKKGGGE